MIRNETDTKRNINRDTCISIVYSNVLRILELSIMTQKQKIMSILKEGVELTSLDGLKIGIIRITNRVNELIHSGVPIKSRWEVRNKKRFKVYFLEN